MKVEVFKCCKCKKECEELWMFGKFDRFKKYWDREYCEKCFQEIEEKLRSKE